MIEPTTGDEDQMRRTIVLVVTALAMLGLTAGVANAGNGYDKEATTTTTTVADTTTTVLATTTTTFDLSDCPSGDESDCAKSVLKCSDLEKPEVTQQQRDAILRDNNQCHADFCVDGVTQSLPYGIDVLEAKTFVKGECSGVSTSPTTTAPTNPTSPPVRVQPKFTG